MREAVSRLSYPARLQDAWRRHLAPKRSDAPTVISTFAGCGGSSLGYSIAGYRELLAVENQKHAVATFRANFPHVAVADGDIATLTVAAILKQTGLRRGELDVLDGSPPCQGFSGIGRRLFDDPRNQLFKEYVRLLVGLKPRTFVLENVPGLVSGKMRLIFAAMITALRDAGYVTKAWVLNPKHYGVPQDRPRLIVLGVRNDQDASGLSAPTPLTPRAITVREALVDVNDDTWRSLAPVNRRIWRRARAGERGCDLGLHFPNCKPTSHFTHVKLNPNRPSPTLTKSGAPNYLHWLEPRSLNIGEAKRLTSFPDAFTIAGSFGEQWSRIGNSVPPLFMAALARHLRTSVLRG